MIATHSDRLIGFYIFPSSFQTCIHLKQHLLLYLMARSKEHTHVIDLGLYYAMQTHKLGGLQLYFSPVPPCHNRKGVDTFFGIQASKLTQ